MLLILSLKNFTCVFTILVKFDIHFLGLPCEILWCYYRLLITSLGLEKGKIFFKLFWPEGFVH